MLGESSTHGTVETSTDSSGGRRRLRPGPAPMNSDRVRSAVSRRDARAPTRPAPGALDKHSTRRRSKNRNVKSQRLRSRTRPADGDFFGPVSSPEWSDYTHRYLYQQPDKFHFYPRRCRRPGAVSVDRRQK
jgi:hypothetical protein